MSETPHNDETNSNIDPAEFDILDYLWTDRTLVVAVRDAKIGTTYRVEYKQAIDGPLKRDSYGGVKGQHKDRAESILDMVDEWVEDEFGYDVLPDSMWSHTKYLRGLSFKERQEFAKLSVGQRQNLVEKLQRGQITLNEVEEDG